MTPREFIQTNDPLALAAVIMAELGQPGPGRTIIEFTTGKELMMSEERTGYTTAGKQSISLADLEASRAGLPHPTAAELDAENELLVRQSLARAEEVQELLLKIKGMEFTIMRLSDRLTRLTAAAREVVTANLDILAGPGHYSPAKDARYEKAFAELTQLLRKGGNE